MALPRGPFCSRRASTLSQLLNLCDGVTPATSGQIGCPVMPAGPLLLSLVYRLSFLKH